MRFISKIFKKLAGQENPSELRSDAEMALLNTAHHTSQTISEHRRQRRNDQTHNDYNFAIEKTEFDERASALKARIRSGLAPVLLTADALYKIGKRHGLKPGRYTNQGCTAFERETFDKGEEQSPCFYIEFMENNTKSPHGHRTAIFVKFYEDHLEGFYRADEGLVKISPQPYEPDKLPIMFGSLLSHAYPDHMNLYLESLRIEQSPVID